MSATNPDDSRRSEATRLAVFGILALAVALRLAHFSSALTGPLSHQPGPDEDYYLRFGEAVAAGRGENAAEFTFMDPGYGYLLGVLFRLLGPNPATLYLVQIVLDVATAYGIVVIGRLLGRPRAGLYGAALYAATATAILFCTALLKETCVAAFLTWWVAAALTLLRSPRKLPWLWFGAFCGLGVALRSTLSLVACLAVLLPWAGVRTEWLGRSACCAAGLVLSLLPWSLRNHAAYGSFSPLPHNGGIVLHQAYNADNPRSELWIPAFVNYAHPSEIWRGYAAEAASATGQSLTPVQVDRYWRAQALGFISSHPAEAMADVGRKALMFLAATEVPNNRSSAEERLFSPVLAWLPPPAPWLLGLGLAGLAWLTRHDRRALVIGAPILLIWVTMAVFWAEDRFRFHAMPLLALCSGVWVDGAVQGISGLRAARAGAGREWTAFGALAAVIVGVSLLLGRHYPPPPIRWDHVVWGYIKMNRLQDAETLAARVSGEQPDNEPILEALGYLAAVRHDYGAAVQFYGRAVTLRPRSSVAHFNLAKAWLASGDRSQAAQEADIARRLNPTVETEALTREIAGAP